MKFTLHSLPFTDEFTTQYSIRYRETIVTVTVEISGNISEIDFRGSETSELWRGTCFELFMRNPGEQSYREINIAPDGRFTHVELSSYRTISHEITFERQPVVTMKQSDKSVSIKIEISGIDLTGKEIAVAVITADHEGIRRFWGIDHWEGKPDFHRNENFFGWSEK